MSRIFISFLGANDYTCCTYFSSNGEREIEVIDVRFIQEAIASTTCRDWSHEDRIIVFTTKQAYKKNWLDNGHKDSNGNLLERQGLKTRLNGLGLEPSIEQIGITDGHSIEEIWKIFNSVLDTLREEEEVVFDITHAFRSIPMLAMVILSYAKVVRRIFVQGIFYGAFEVLGRPQEVEKLPLNQRRAPILDLTPFNELLDWTAAIDRFLEAGDASMAVKLAQQSINPVLRETRGKDQSARATQNMAKNLDAFARAIRACRGQEIHQLSKNLKQAVSTCAADDGLHSPLVPLVDRLNERLEDFSGDQLNDGIQAARWCLQHNLIQQGFTILQETVNTEFTIRADLDPSDVTFRILVGQAIRIKHEEIKQEEWKSPAAEHPDLIYKLMGLLPSNHSFFNDYKNITSFRNDMNHAGFRSNPLGAEKLPKKLEELIDKLEATMTNS